MDLTSQITVTSATDGNHGRSVAWAADLLGCKCVIYIHAEVSLGRQKAIEAYGARVIRVNGNYDAAVRQADLEAKIFNRIIVSDNSYPGYMEIPKDVMLGYSVMLNEIVQQLNDDIPTHVFVQGGCGCIGSVVAGYFWDLWGEQRPSFIIVEPEEANCLQLSAIREELSVVEGKLETLMTGLACSEVSLLAWKILETGCDHFITLSDNTVPVAMRLLATSVEYDPKIEAGESAVVGIGALIVATQNQLHSKTLKLDANSKVLVIGTEGATDPDFYSQLVTQHISY